MQISLSSILTVYYDDQLCVGLAERAEEGRYNAARKRWRSVSSSESRSASRSTVGIDADIDPYAVACAASIETAHATWHYKITERLFYSHSTVPTGLGVRS